jgi:hypothetical protein
LARSFLTAILVATALLTGFAAEAATACTESMEGHHEEDRLALDVCMISSAPAFATCTSEAADRKLAGRALKSFMTRCDRDVKTTCEADAKEKMLAGAAKTSYIKYAKNAVGR